MGSPVAWVAARYLPLAWGSLGVAVVLHLFVGGTPELLVDVWFLLLNLGAHVLRRLGSQRAVALHLVGLGPMIFWYCSLPGGVPAQLDEQAVIFASLCALPNLVLASLYGWRWALLSTPLAIAGVLALIGSSGQFVTGAFLLGISGLLGAGFYHRLLTALAGVQRRLAAAAYQDPMTGLSNRRAFAADFERIIAAGRPGPVVAVWDVDGLKAVNDELGHGAGDAYLLQFVAALDAGCDPDASLYRIGGDEFVSCHAAGADTSSVVESVRAEFPWVSVGIVAAGGRSLNAVLSDADRLLYADKGRRGATRIR